MSLHLCSWSLYQFNLIPLIEEGLCAQNFLNINIHICDTLAAGCAYMYVYIYVYMHAYCFDRGRDRGFVIYFSSFAGFRVVGVSVL